MSKRRLLEAILVLAVITAGQFLLYGPSLVGEKVLLPVDLLTKEKWYLPRTPDVAAVVPHNIVLSDPVLAIEPHRRFAASEIRAGRLPLWNPYNYLGTPMARWAPFSPTHLLYYLFPEPIGLAWIQLLKSLVAGLGAWLFFRRVLKAGAWPAAIGGVCYPITGFYVLWQGFPLTDVALWLPWILLATDRAVRQPAGWGGPALTLATALTLWSGKVDIAGQVLLASGVYALWAVVDELRGAGGKEPRERLPWKKLPRRSVRPLATASAAWALGILLAMPYVLPLGEYLRTGARVADRVAGSEERPPVGLGALPQMVMPDYYGSWMHDSVRIVPGNRLASSAATYVGLLAAALLVPLAWCSRRDRSRNLLWLGLAVLGAGWTLNVPGIVHLLRLPGLNLLSHNRFVFVTAFALLAMAVTGLNWLARAGRERKLWFALPFTGVALFGAWLYLLSNQLPAQLAAQLARRLEAGETVLNVPDLATLARVQQTLTDNYRWGAWLCVATCAAWVLVWVRKTRKPWLVPVLGAALLAELLRFGHGLAAQSDPELYYPGVPALERLAEQPPGRSLCIDCLPPGLNQRFRLSEVRGYDGIDPARLLELLNEIEDPAAPPAESYAPVMWFRPAPVPPSAASSPALGEATGRAEVLLPPILDMLGVRYVIRRGSPPPNSQPLIAGDDHWVVENRRALPRAFVPRQVGVAASREERLERLTTADFDPAEVAWLEKPVELPPRIAGSVRLAAETPTRIDLELALETPALVVLSDLWYPGWRARIDGVPAEVLRVNHALRGVLAPAGAMSLVFDYRPGSFRLGILLATAALTALGFWGYRIWRPRPNHNISI